MTSLDSQVNKLYKSFSERSGLRGLEYELIAKNDRSILVIYVSHTTERLFSVLNESLGELDPGEQSLHATLKQRTREDILSGPEAKLLLKVLSESQNINQHSFSQDFLERYTPSVSGAENLIISHANHIVTGRRGAGKSMLLLYTLKQRERLGQPNIWIDVQSYSGRDDDQLVKDFLVELLYNISFSNDCTEEIVDVRSALEREQTTTESLRRYVPRLRRLFGRLSSSNEMFVFIDDLHVFSERQQPLLMDFLYALARGNRVFLKISAIENLVRTYDPDSKQGMEFGQDVQKLGLDYNLTMPDKAAKHIEAILDSHARYSGVSSIRRLCATPEVINRLTWVSAGVPRDALNLFGQAMLKAGAQGKKRVAVQNVNMAASESLSIKLKELQADASDRASRLRTLLEQITEFCITQKRSNALLVEIISNSERFKDIQSLVQLRILHVISEGITPKEAGKKFIALILDYGLYTGVRAASSVELFNKQTKSVPAKDLRSLPIFRPSTISA